MRKRQNWYTKYQYRSFQTFVNPEILEFSEEKVTAWEGCISNDEELCLLERPKEVLVRFNDIKGKQYELVCNGLVARIFQHELDHLDGELMWNSMNQDLESLVPRKLIDQILISEIEKIGTE